MTEQANFAFLFEGQGQLKVGGGIWAQLKEEVGFKQTFFRADELCKQEGLPFLVSEACFNTENSLLEGPNYDPVASQLTLLTGSTGMARFLHANNVPRAKVNTGHSLGQVPAAVECQFLPFDTAFKLTVGRSRAMERVSKAKNYIVAIASDKRDEAGDLLEVVNAKISELGDEVSATKVSVVN